MPRQVLFIAYDFPPRGGSGVQRTVKFASYLPEFGWSVTVVCPDWSLRSSGRDDADLITQLPDDVAVVTAGPPAAPRWAYLWRWLERLPRGWAYARKLKANCTFPDYAGPWRHRAIETCQQLLEGGGFDAVYSTSPPATTHVVGLRIKEQFDLPWIVDLRDPWTDNPITQRHLWRWRNRLEKGLERKVYAAANCIIANTNTNRADLLRRYSLDESKVVTIPNGYDEKDFTGETVSPPEHVFRVCYCGAARGSYNPSALLTAYREFVRRVKPAASMITFAGTVCNWLRKNESPQWLEEHAELLSYVPHQKVPSLLLGSHVVVSINPPDSPECVPGKVYELLRCGRPILNVCDSPSEVEDIIAATQSGESFRHEDVDGMAAFLKRHYDEWSAGRSAAFSSPKLAAIESYERRRQTAQLADVLNAAAARVHGDRSHQNGKIFQPHKTLFQRR